MTTKRKRFYLPKDSTPEAQAERTRELAKRTRLERQRRKALKEYEASDLHTVVQQTLGQDNAIQPETSPKGKEPMNRLDKARHQFEAKAEAKAALLAERSRQRDEKMTALKKAKKVRGRQFGRLHEKTHKQQAKIGRMSEVMLQRLKKSAAT